MEVIQIPLENQLKPLSNIRTRTYFIVHDHLDKDVLKAALDRLIRDHWRKLGARLVLRRDKNLEYHLPPTFHDKYELFRWTSRDDGRPLGEAAPSLQAAASEKTVALFDPITTIEKTFRPSDWPLERKDEPPDAPLLHVHFTSFSDASVVAMSCPHVTMDQFGLRNIIKAWLTVVEGRSPPPMVGYDYDVFRLKAYTEFPKNEVFRKGKMRVRRPGEYFFVVAPFVPDLIFRKEEAHMVFFPHSLVDSLRARASKGLEEKYGVPPGISKGDIITAVLLKLQRMHDKKTRKMCLSQALNLRNRVPALEGDKAEAFIHNALIYTCARFLINQNTPMSEIAYQNRLVLKNVQQKEIEIELAVSREMARRGQAIHICEPFDRSYSITNWTAAWRDLDFTHALKAIEGKERVRPKFIVLGFGGETKTPVRYSSTIMSSTNEGFWCSFAASVQAMKKIHEYLEKDPMLENF